MTQETVWRHHKSGLGFAAKDGISRKASTRTHSSCWKGDGLRSGLQACRTLSVFIFLQMQALFCRLQCRFDTLLLKQTCTISLDAETSLLSHTHRTSYATLMQVQASLSRKSEEYHHMFASVPCCCESNDVIHTRVLCVLKQCAMLVARNASIVATHLYAPWMAVVLVCRLCSELGLVISSNIV